MIEDAFAEEDEDELDIRTPLILRADGFSRYGDKKVAYENFRNIAEAEVAFTPGTNVLWGNNAQGKTNILGDILLRQREELPRVVRTENRALRRAVRPRRADVSARGERERNGA